MSHEGVGLPGLAFQKPSLQLKEPFLLLGLTPATAHSESYGLRIKPTWLKSHHHSSCVTTGKWLRSLSPSNFCHTGLSWDRR